MRLDLALVEGGLVASRDKAKALIMAGEVLINGQVELKADRAVGEVDLLELKQKYPYVSRGAFKLEAAARLFNMPIVGQRVFDVGVSTGGFCDYLLQHGAQGVIGLDVNVRQVADPIRKDPRVTLIEKNVKFLVPEDLPYIPDWVVIDLSFISILWALSVLTFLGDRPILGMVKPQFESPKGEVGKGGIVRDPRKVEKVLLKLMGKARDLGYGIKGIAPAGIKGKKGNQEYFLLLRYGLASTIDDKMVRDVIESL
jgi:23S rRNA (cytidine1920-2'-O)/16S rRNA (cytidine1409-2'-O)-methyltransferase